MRKTPAYLKGLAERRARAAGDVERLERLLERLRGELEQARNLMTSCDALIRDFDPELNPHLIQPIRATKGRHAGYGAVLDAVLAAVKLAAPRPASSAEVSLYVQAVLKIQFESEQHYETWFHNALTRALRKLAARGELTRVPDLTDPSNRAGLWQWPNTYASLDALRESAAATGAVVATTAEVGADVS